MTLCWRMKTCGHKYLHPHMLLADTNNEQDHYSPFPNFISKGHSSNITWPLTAFNKSITHHITCLSRTVSIITTIDKYNCCLLHQFQIGRHLILAYKLYKPKWVIPTILHQNSYPYFNCSLLSFCYQNALILEMEIALTKSVWACVWFIFFFQPKYHPLHHNLWRMDLWLLNVYSCFLPRYVITLFDLSNRAKINKKRTFLIEKSIKSVSYQ